MATGDSGDILSRVKRDLPARWFNTTAPIRDAVLGGLADAGAWLYSMIVYAKQQTRLATASGLWLDLYAYDFLALHLRRRATKTDDEFRAKMRKAILQERVTRKGMAEVLTDLTGSSPRIFEPWNTFDTGGWDSPTLAWAGEATNNGGGGGWDIACGWDTNSWNFGDLPTSTIGSAGSGGWGSTDLPAQVFIDTKPPIAQGVPFIGGFDTNVAALDGGITEWVDDDMLGVGPLTTEEVYDAIRVTKPTGVTAWVRISQ